MGRFKYFGCLVEGCEGKHEAKGYCNNHYQRFRRGNDPASSTSPVRDYMNMHLSKETDECFPWPYSTTEDGYARIRIDGKDFRVHQIACELANGPKPNEESVVRHLCGNGHLGCFNPRHVVWGTVTENNRDRIDHETITRGTDNHFHKLKEHEVMAIYGSFIPNRLLAIRYEVNITAIQRIKNGKSWSWLTGHKKKGGG